MLQGTKREKREEVFCSHFSKWPTRANSSNVYSELSVHDIALILGCNWVWEMEMEWAWCQQPQGMDFCLPSPPPAPPPLVGTWNPLMGLGLTLLEDKAVCHIGSQTLIFESWYFHLLALWPWERHLTFLSFTSLERDTDSYFMGKGDGVKIKIDGICGH